MRFDLLSLQGLSINAKDAEADQPLLDSPCITDCPEAWVVAETQIFISPLISLLYAGQALMVVTAGLNQIEMKREPKVICFTELITPQRFRLSTLTKLHG